MTAPTTIVVLTFILNGTPVHMMDPVLYIPEGPAQEQQVLVPVRAVFEELGYIVDWQDAHSPHVIITGDWRKLPMAKTRYVGKLFVGENLLRESEYTTALSVAPYVRDGTLYAPLMVVRILTGAEVRWDAQTGTVECEHQGHGEPPLLKVEDILGDTVNWLHRRVRLEGEFLGIEGDPDCPATAQGIPVPGAWVVRDNTGSIYCTNATTGLRYGGMTYIEPGTFLFMNGVLRDGYGGIPYLAHVQHGIIEAVSEQRGR
ncbi:MAG: copper amine oxidase N-terminal domain-containing protein [Armatimonadetes bacterium]|nr:copper amine oxidase N-terminal domain-containing protein [Armatimonadota bacterium]